MMRARGYLTTFLSISVLFLTSAASAQDVEVAESAGPLNTVTIDPIDIALGGWLGVEYERAVLDYLSVYGGPSINFGITADEGQSLFGIAGGLGTRLFPFGDAPEGFFIGPDLSLAYVSGDEGGIEASSFGWAVTGIIGYTFLIADMVDLSLGLGAGYGDFEATGSSDGVEVTIGYAGFIPTARLAVGAAF